MTASLRAKIAVESHCPRVVTSADVMAVVTRDKVKCLSGDLSLPIQSVIFDFLHQMIRSTALTSGNAIYHNLQKGFGLLGMDPVLASDPRAQVYVNLNHAQVYAKSYYFTVTSSQP